MGTGSWQLAAGLVQDVTIIVSLRQWDDMDTSWTAKEERIERSYAASTRQESNKGFAKGQSLDISAGGAVGCLS